MKKLATVALALGAAVSIASMAMAAENHSSQNEAKAKASGQIVVVNPDGKALISGTVSAVSSSSLTVKSWGGSWTVNIGTSTDILAKGGDSATSSLSQIKAGDAIRARGQVSATANLTIDASSIRDLSLRAVKADKDKEDLKKAVSGVISNLSSDGKSFVLTLKNGTALKVTLSSDAKINVAGKSSDNETSADLKSGMHASVSGSLDQSAKTLSATRVNANLFGKSE